MIVFTGIRGGTSVTSGGNNLECEAEDAGGSRSGLSRLWAIPCGAVSSISFNANQDVTAVSLRCDTPETDWQEIGFAEGSGQFSENQRGVNRYDQLLTVTIEGQSSYNRRQINALGSCSCWHFLALDEAGIYHYLGVHTYQRSGVTRWESAGMEPTGNQAQTGVAVTEGNNQVQLVITVPGVHQLAPHAIGAPDRISVPCSDNAACGPLGLNALNGDCLESLDNQLLEKL